MVSPASRGVTALSTKLIAQVSVPSSGHVARGALTAARSVKGQVLIKHIRYATAV